MTDTYKFLYIEDSPENQYLIEFYLKKQPVELTCCTSGSEAISALEQDPDFDIIIIDLNLPGEISSDDVMEYIKDHLADTPVYIMSAMTRGEIAEKTKLYDIQDYLIKPVRKKEFLQTVSKSCPELEM